MSDRPNLREWTRINQVLDASLHLDDGTTINGKTRNISANGALIETESIAETGAAGELTLVRRDGVEAITIKGRGEVVRTDDTGIAFHLSSLTGEESYAHLRNLILHCAGEEAGKAEREFEEHIGLERHKN